MNVTRTNTVLAALLVVTTALIVASDVDYTRPNVEFLPEMKRSAASDAYAANTVLPQGRTLQVPVRGTVPRGDLPLYFSATKEDAIRAGEELLNPYTLAMESASGASSTAEELPADEATESVSTKASDEDSGTDVVQSASRRTSPAEELAASVQRGAKAYGVYCVACHGATGAGDGPVAKRGFPPPPPLPTGKSASMKDGQLFHILTYGQGSMASMAAQLTRDRRWDVINYVRSLQESAKQSQAAAAAAPETSSEASTPEASAGPSSEKEAQP